MLQAVEFPTGVTNLDTGLFDKVILKERVKCQWWERVPCERERVKEVEREGHKDYLTEPFVLSWVAPWCLLTYLSDMERDDFAHGDSSEFKETKRVRCCCCC
jgi:hypothetical protein